MPEELSVVDQVMADHAALVQQATEGDPAPADPEVAVDPAAEAAFEAARAKAEGKTDPTPTPEETPADQTASDSATDAEKPADDAGGAAPAAPAAPAAETPAWSKPLENVQHKLSEYGKKLDDALALLKANPTAANQQTAVAVQAQKDELAEIEAEIADPNYDAYAQGPKAIKALLAQTRVLQTRLAERDAADNQQKAVDAGWAKFAAEHPAIGVATGQKLMDEAAAEVAAHPALSTMPNAAQVLFWQKVEKAKATPAATPKPTPAPKAPSPVTSSGGRLTPQATEVRPKPPARTLDDKVKAGEFALSDEFGF